MYIQITTRCNMECAHCCYSCTAQGDDMSLETFRAALQLCEEYGEIPFLGGGEPTVHPDFYTMLLESIACASRVGNGPMGMVTNGKRTQIALVLAQLTKADVISVELSRDEYHEQIDLDVVRAFENTGTAGSQRGNIRDTSYGSSLSPLPHGRALDLLDDDARECRDAGDCPCDSWVIKPNGDIHQCGCDDSPKVGSLAEGVESPSFNLCYLDSEWVNLCLENELYHLLD